MSRPELPVGEDNVPDKALEELLAAFAVHEPVAPEAIDFDDPSIDEMLGLGKDASPVGDASPVPITEQIVAIDPEAPSEAAGPVAVGPVAAPRETVKIGDGDDLPDALYLDEEAGDRLRGTTNRSTEASIRDERTTILIADDEVEGSSGGIPIGTGSASMDPRLRARRIAVKRAVGRRRLKWFVIAGLVIALLTAGFAVLGSSLFAVDAGHLTISGSQRISAVDLDAAVNKIVGHPVLLINTHAIEAQLEKSPWVSRARVSTDFPHSASIELLERVPLATYQGSDGKFRIIDVEGIVVDAIENQPAEFMLITGQGIDAVPGTSAGTAYQHAAELVEALSPAVRSRTASVAVGDTGSLTLVFHSGLTVALGSPTELLDKLTRLEAYLKRDTADQCTTPIDVSTPEICTPK